RLRGTVYDCNGVPLTENEQEQVTVVLPTRTASITLSEMLKGDELESALDRIRQGQAVTVWGQTPVTSGGWQGFSVASRYSDTLTHVLGYTGADGHGLTGVEKAYDGLLYTDEFVGLSYSTDSQGRAIEGVAVEVFDGETQNSVTLTVDSRIQSVAEQAMSGVEAGAAVILEARTGKLKAVVSCPDYDTDNIADALTAENSPLINRATYSYNVGSVFKPCLAAAALENGLSDYRYTCTGSITVGDLTFKCNKSAGHGELGLKEALSYSCNTYFYTLSEKLGAEKVYNMAKVFRFGQETDCGGGLVSSGGAVPELSTLQSIPAELTNLSIGQGELLLSPIAIANMYSAIVNGGEYRLPYIVQSTEQQGVEQRNEPSLPTVAFSKKTADILKEYLENALQNGTGSAAFSEGVAAGGKTGTAQTGWVEDGRKILNGWFCGFYEGNENYVIVILKEDVSSGSTDCAPIFREITQNLQKLGL
ncbi:MAG: penicillin-binding protein 2, partial [Clostridia bacterium]|nr:penicillin-binding protein 2 [Clostridia bacterium]